MKLSTAFLLLSISTTVAAKEGSRLLKKGDKDQKKKVYASNSKDYQNHYLVCLTQQCDYFVRDGYY